MNVNNGGRGSSSAASSNHRGQLSTTDTIVPPLGILPLNSLHHHSIGILPHLTHPIREVGTAAHIGSSPPVPTSAISGTTSTSGGGSNCSHASPQSQIATSGPIVSTTTTAAVRTSSVGDGSAVDYASLFECPVCMDYALPPILQCQSGHIVCASCRSKLSSCPTCRGNLDNIRNLAMEKLASSVLFPCKYSISGCTETFHYSAKPDHEILCEFRPYDCPCPGTSCKWLGELSDVMPHLLHNHKSITTLQGEDIVFLATDINLPGAVDWVMMQSCFGHNFMLVLEKQERVPDQLFFALVQLIGTRKQAEQFVYRLELNGHKRRLTWEACPRSIHDGVQSAISSSDCLVFYSNTAQLFADNGNLGINVTITQVPTSVGG